MEKESLMDCSDYRKLLSREIDGEIDRSLLEALEGHLRSCESCRMAREVLRETFTLHREIGELEPPRLLTQDVMDGIVEPARRNRFAGFIRAAVPVAAAAVLVLGIFAGTFLTKLYERPSAEQRLAVLELEYLDEFPPGSMGDLIMEVTEGGGDERRE